MRTRFGLILKITVSERISKITARTKSYVSLKNAISQNRQIHERNYHSFQGPTPIIQLFQLFLALVLQDDRKPGFDRKYSQNRHQRLQSRDVRNTNRYFHYTTSGSISKNIQHKAFLQLKHPYISERNSSTALGIWFNQCHLKSFSHTNSFPNSGI